ncbi:MAG: DUF1801 domain-containing protein [Candidatus Marsarchaeota archaeon]|nr:DUF1801 domain-containing protein [Candidatus Marsarchaeota archaeon]
MKGQARKAKGLSKEEIAAMKKYPQELNAGKQDGEKAVMAAIAKMKEPDRSLAKRVHAIVTKTAPSLVPRTWYGMPAYSKEDKVICFFQNAGKFRARYSTFGFSDKAKLDNGRMWPTSSALKGLTASEEGKIRELVKRAIS